MKYRIVESAPGVFDAQVRFFPMVWFTISTRYSLEGAKADLETYRRQVEWIDKAKGFKPKIYEVE